MPWCSLEWSSVVLERYLKTNLLCSPEHLRIHKWALLMSLLVMSYLTVSYVLQEG
jgi:hypothetical protein